MIWEAMLKGMASAGWLIGFVVILGLFLVIVGLLGLAFMAIFGGEEEDKEDPDANYGVPTGKAKDAEEDDL
jgi:hypothetical protein